MTGIGVTASFTTTAMQWALKTLATLLPSLLKKIVPLCRLKKENIVTATLVILERHHPTDDGYFVWPVEAVLPQLHKQ